MPHKLIIIGVVATIVAVLSFITAGCVRHCSSPEKKAQWAANRIKKKLKLNDEQAKTVDKIKEEILAKKADFESLKEGLHKDFLEQIKSDSFDETKINQVLESKERKFKELRLFLVDKAGEFHAILTPEQREKLAKKAEKMHKRHSRRHCK